MAYIAHSQPATSDKRAYLHDLWLRLATPFLFARVLFEMVSHPENYSLDDDI